VNKPLELPLLYGTIAYRMMLAHNSMRGFRTVWMPPDYKLEWVRVPWSRGDTSDRAQPWWLRCAQRPWRFFMSVAPSAPGPVN
jgi:hypothetical protein